MVEIPKNLLESIKSKNAVLFLGAGAAKGAIHPKGESVPDGMKLRDLISDKFLSGHLKDRSLAEVAEYAVNETDLPAVQRFIRDTFVPYSAAPFHKIIPLFPWRAILTTNIDLIIEDAYEKSPKRAQDLVPIYKNSQKFDQEVRAKPNPVEYLKLHGSCDQFLDLEIPFILATEQYAKFSRARTRLFSRLTDLASEYNVVFCGYSALDPHVQAVLYSMFDLGAVRPAYFMVKPNFDEFEERFWSGKRVTPIAATFETFLNSLTEAMDPALTAAGARAMGSSLAVSRFYRRTNVTETTDLRSFLSQDFEYVHSGMRLTDQPAADFYRGYDTGFYPISANMDARRNLTDATLASIFLRTDEEHGGTDFHVVSAPAGAGKTILLKRLAWEAATEFECLVLFHQPSGSFRTSAIEELFSYVGRRIFLIIDRAAYYVDEIANLVDELRSKKLPITIITAERENEWNVRCDKLDQRIDSTIELHKLAHNEIEALVKKLADFHALGRLAELSPDEQIKEFEIRAERQILVMLYELTQGVPFEKLIVDEYERIIPTEAQLLYLDVCCLNRLNVPVRAGLISRIANIHFSEFKSRFLEPLKKIVTAERDPYIGDMMYSSRHSTIAQIVFENILSEQERRFDALTRIIKHMNLSYSSDETAFKAMVTGREIAGLFPSQELGRQFFDLAISIADSDPAVLQQRAIFEINHSGGSPKVGLEWIEKAEKIRPHDRSIRHTKGNILRACANAEKNSLKKDELRRAAKYALAPLANTDARQPHGFHTLALVWLDDIRDYLEQKGDSIETEDRVLVEKLEELQRVIRNGLSVFPDESRLLAAESEYYKLIQNDKRALQSLSKAFERNRRLDWIAVRLANVYRLAGDMPTAEKILRSAVDVNPSSKDANFALGRILADADGDSDTPTAVEYLRRAFTKGDSNFGAQLWYGRELFIAGRTQEANAIFNELSKVPIASGIKKRIVGAIKLKDGSPKIYRGTVVKKDEGYLFIAFDQFESDIFAFRGEVRSSNWNLIKLGFDVEAKIGFTYRGPCAFDVHLAS